MPLRKFISMGGMVLPRRLKRNDENAQRKAALKAAISPANVSEPAVGKLNIEPVRTRD
jgi:hypothetical protein